MTRRIPNISFVIFILDPDIPESFAPTFGSCEELRAHGVEMDGYFIIDGQETYCKDTWSKLVLNLSLLVFYLA